MGCCAANSHNSHGALGIDRRRSARLGFATLLVGLAIVVPVLGHATWHLYRRVVERDSPQVGRLIGAEGKEEADPEPIADPLRAAEEIEREEEKRVRLNLLTSSPRLMTSFFQRARSLLPLRTR